MSYDPASPSRPGPGSALLLALVTPLLVLVWAALPLRSVTAGLAVVGLVLLVPRLSRRGAVVLVAGLATGLLVCVGLVAGLVWTFSGPIG